MHDAHPRFGDDRQPKLQQVIVVFVNRAGEGVFNRHDGVTDLAVGESTKNFLEALTRQVLQIRPQQLPRGLFAKGPSRSLECNFRARHRSIIKLGRGGASNQPARAAFLRLSACGAGPSPLCLFRLNHQRGALEIKGRSELIH